VQKQLTFTVNSMFSAPLRDLFDIALRLLKDGGTSSACSLQVLKERERSASKFHFAPLLSADGPTTADS
jgi:hypothetical protein